jgi:hypothetical protein
MNIDDDILNSKPGSQMKTTSIKIRGSVPSRDENNIYKNSWFRAKLSLRHDFKLSGMVARETEQPC